MSYSFSLEIWRCIFIHMYQPETKYWWELRVNNTETERSIYMVSDDYKEKNQRGRGIYPKKKRKYLFQVLESTSGGPADMVALTSMVIVVVLCPASITIPAVFPLRRIFRQILQHPQYTQFNSCITANQTSYILVDQSCMRDDYSYMFRHSNPEPVQKEGYQLVIAIAAHQKPTLYQRDSLIINSICLHSSVPWQILTHKCLLWH